MASFFERRDAMFVIGSSFVSNACIASNPRLDFKSCVDAVNGVRETLTDIVFPYLNVRHEDDASGDFDSLFDELDRIQAERDGRSKD